MSGDKLLILYNFLRKKLVSYRLLVHIMFACDLAYTIVIAYFYGLRTSSLLHLYDNNTKQIVLNSYIERM